MQELIRGTVRVQALNSNILRVEREKDGTFCDRDTFFIPDRASVREGDCALQWPEEGPLAWGEYEVYVPEMGLAGLRVCRQGREVYRLKALKNTGELPPLTQTPEVFAVCDCPRIFLPEGGYSNLREGEYRVEEDAQDVYLILCREDPRLLRKLYTALTGRCEMVRLATLGSWNSKYFAYDEESAKQLILDYEAHDIPLDVMVIDTDWRTAEAGWGYDINEKLFPDMGRFLDFAHSHGVEVIFNDHPEPLEGRHVFEGEEIAYREKHLTRLMEMGLDMWWYDRNWQTHLITPTPGVRFETLGMYLFADITKNHSIRRSGDGEIYRRPVIMGNVSNIINGVYEGIADSASHRYSIQWTGDIASSPGDLSQEVSSLLRAGNNCIGYCSADIGGHVGDPDRETFVRWMQFGALSPILRPHCTNSVQRTREPWVFDRESEDIIREYINLRYRLLPVIYGRAYENYRDGAPIFAHTHWFYPGDFREEKLEGQYLLGENLLIAPVGGRFPQQLKPEHYTAPVQAVYYDGLKRQGAPLATAQYDTLSMRLAHESPEPGVPVYNFSARFETAVRFDRPVQLILCIDDGATVYLDGQLVLQDDKFHGATNFFLAELEPDREYSLRVDYFQGGGEAACLLCYLPVEEAKNTEVYFPQGRWLDVFTGRIHERGKCAVAPKEAQMPMFVRLGSLIPLACNARNTASQRWDKLLLDYYPSRDAADRGRLYEDDGWSTAYKQGAFRTGEYEARFDGRDSYEITLHPAVGTFEGPRAVASREMTLKFHELCGERVRAVFVNGEEVPFMRKEKAEAFPLSWEEAAPDADTVWIQFRQNVQEPCRIRVQAGG